MSDTYTIQTNFKVCYADVPADKYMSENCSFDQRVTITNSGFKLMRCYLTRKSKRVVKISLKDVPYRYESEDSSYSYSGRYICQAVADFLRLNVNGISISDNTIYFSMQNLKTKKVPVELVANITFQKQKQLYSKPVITPDSIDIFGNEQVIDTISSVKTNTITLTNLSKDVVKETEIDLLNGMISSTTDMVTVSFDVEQYTEANYEVRLVHNQQGIKLFPEKVSVKCMVPVKDYPILNPTSFLIKINENDLSDRKTLLRYSIVSKPDNVKIIKTEPEKIEYIIIQD